MLALSVITVSADNDGKVESINQAEFSEKIFDYSTREKPVIKSERPAVIDFKTVVRSVPTTRSGDGFTRRALQGQGGFLQNKH